MISVVEYTFEASLDDDGDPIRKVDQEVGILQSGLDVQMSAGAAILGVAIGKTGMPVMWTREDLSKPKEVRSFFVTTIGEQIERSRFIGTMVTTNKKDVYFVHETI